VPPTQHKSEALLGTDAILLLMANTSGKKGAEKLYTPSLSFRSSAFCVIFSSAALIRAVLEVRGFSDANMFSCLIRFEHFGRGTCVFRLVRTHQGPFSDAVAAGMITVLLGRNAT